MAAHWLGVHNFLVVHKYFSISIQSFVQKLVHIIWLPFLIICPRANKENYKNRPWKVKPYHISEAFTPRPAPLDFLLVWISVEFRVCFIGWDALWAKFAKLSKHGVTCLQVIILLSYFTKCHDCNYIPISESYGKWLYFCWIEYFRINPLILRILIIDYSESKNLVVWHYNGLI